MKFLSIIVLILWSLSCSHHQLPVILLTPNATPIEKSTAKELVRYIYLRTGSLAEIQSIGSAKDYTKRFILVIAAKEASSIPAPFPGFSENLKKLPENSCLLQSSEKGLIIAGSNDSLALNGAFRYLEKRLAIGFYKNKVVVPDGGIQNIDISGLNQLIQLPEFTTDNAFIRFLKQVPDEISSSANEHDNMTLNKQSASQKTQRRSTEDTDSRNTDETFINHWCFVQFGISIAEESGKIMNELNHNWNKDFSWIDSPLKVPAIRKNWQELEPTFDFVKRFENLLLPVKGKGNLERYQQWLHTFQYEKAMTHLGCELFLLNESIKNMNELTSEGEKEKFFQTTILPRRKQILDIWSEARIHLISGIYGQNEQLLNFAIDPKNTPLQKTDSLLEAQSFKLPALPVEDIKIKLKIVVPYAPDIRSTEDGIRLKIYILGWFDAEKTMLYWKPIGESGDYKTAPIKPIGKNLYEINLSPGEIRDHDIEYFINVLGKGESTTFPITAPEINQVVMVKPG